MTATHPDALAFSAAIVADPADDVARLVFADWLEEHGDADRAEFIRLQVELHRTPELVEVVRPAHERDWTSLLTPARDGRTFEYTDPKRLLGVIRELQPHARVEPLRLRERAILRNRWDDWCPAAKPPRPYTFAIDQSGPAFGATVRVLHGDGEHMVVAFSRGWASEVSAPAAVLFGRPCERCGGSGRGRRVAAPCVECLGARRTEGVAADLARACPLLERVTLTDREPTPRDEPAGFGLHRIIWGWYAIDAPDEPMDYDLPECVWARLAGGFTRDPDSAWRWYDSSDDALAALAAAALAECRARAAA